MALPAYSIVVVDTTSNGVTTSAATVYNKVSDAKAAYKTAIESGHRAFLYEKPFPTLSHRNDSQPLVA